MNYVEHNQRAWNKVSDSGSLWAKPVDDATMARAARGDWTVSLMGLKPVPRAWFGDIIGKRILCLGSGGGQQVPILAAAGAIVTSFDIAEAQLEKDRLVCERHRLKLTIEQGDMQDLARFEAGVFDMIFHPVSNTYIPDVKLVWQECYRVLSAGGALLAGFINPLNFLFAENDGSDDTGLHVINSIPYAEVDTLSPLERDAALQRRMLLTWGHTLEDQIGAQLEAGFVMTGFYEGRRQDDRAPSINRYINTYIATRAIKEPIK